MTVKALMFTSCACAPCKAMKPVVTEVAQAAGVPLEVIDVTGNSALVETYALRAVPTIVLMGADDKEVNRLVGAKPRAVIEEFFA